MEQQTTQLATISRQFSEMQKLPDVLQQNQALAQRAANTCKQTLDLVKGIDFATVDAQVMEVHDASLSELQVKLRDAYKLMQERRKPYTSFFDELKALFTKEEGSIETIGKEVKALRDGWQKEKGKRIQLEDQKKQAELQKKQEEIDMAAYCKSCLHSNYIKAVNEVFTKLNNAFNSQTLESFDEYVPKLTGYTPILDDATYTAMIPICNAKPQFYTMQQMEVIYKRVADGERAELSKDWTSRLTAERDRLIELVPSRKRELERMATDATAAQEAQARIEQERQEREAHAAKEAEERKAAAQSEAEMNKMNTAFDQAAEATPVVGISKGTVTKRKYVPNSHKAWAALLQHWVANEMAKCTMDDLQKKFGFARTAAEKSLNEGIEIKAEGLSIEIDYSTRATRGSRKEVA